MRGATTTARPGFLRPVAQFVAVGLAVAVVLALGTSWLSRRAAVDEAVHDAQATTALIARSIVQPSLPPGLVTGVPAALDRFDRTIRNRVLGDRVLRVKIWDAGGRVLYSDDPRLIGRRYQLGAGELAILEAGGIEAEASDLRKPENIFERPLGRLLEVYTQVRSKGRPLLFEAYYSFADVDNRSSAIVSAFRPITVGGLLVFLLLSVPIVWLLARRLAVAGAERERLLQLAVQASDTERRRIAADLHDGVVQELAGATFTLAATAREADQPRDADGRQALRAELSELAALLRRSIRSLRSLLVEIYPADLGNSGLAAAVDDLVGRVSSDGIEVVADIPDTTALPVELVELLWRTTQECVRNAVRHGRPRHLDIDLDVTRDEGRVALQIRDDGSGFDPDQPVPQGHVGLRSLSDLARQAGGSFSLTSRPGAGTVARLEVPLR